MAKLSSYYTLCPLIDGQIILGVEKDSDVGCAIVTLGRNIVIRYKLQDLKQVSSWSSKERLTTQVIYNKKADNYVAVFNEKHVRVWEKKETDLDKVKRYKFNNPFNTILSGNDGSIVLVRQDGATASLEWALENRKKWLCKGILNSNEKLSDCRLIHINNQTHLCGLVQTGQSYSYIIVKLHEENYLGDSESFSRFELKRTSEQLVGHVVLQDENNAYLLTLWSHGRLYSYPLTGPCPNALPGMLVSVFSSISTRHPIVMTALNESTIAAYGADVNEEGAVLLIYNTQFKLVQAVQKLKLYTREAKLWRIDDKLLLAANRHLAIAPYRLASQRIETMLGSSLRFKESDNIKREDNDIIEIQESIVASWEDPEPLSTKIPMAGIPRQIKKQINVFLNEGTNDAAIQQALIPQLIESKDISTIFWCLDNLKDLPEELLTGLLSFCLRTPESTFKPVQNGTPKRKSMNTIPITREDFLDRLFSTTFSDIYLLPFLKSELTFNEVLRLLNYLIAKFNSEPTETTKVGPNEKQLYEWASLLLDSHYQHYLLSQDSEVLNMFNKLGLILQDDFQMLKELEELRPMIFRILNRKPVKINATDFNKFYSIEELQLC